MRKLTLLLPLLILLSPVSPISPLTPLPADADRISGWNEHRLIAHAMGGIDGHSYTNSYEAFEANYKNGFRVFEVDLLLTSDGRLVARHDWTSSMFKRLNQENPGVKNMQPLSWEQFKALPIQQKYRPLDLDDILQLMEKFPDMYLVTDTKSTETHEIQKQFRVLTDKLLQVDPSVGKRIIPQLYDQNMYDLLEEIFPFDSYIYTLYESKDSDKQVLRFVKETPKVMAVTMNESRVSKSFAAALKSLGIRTYVHTINDVTLYNKYRKMGVYGIYTDFISVPKTIV
jgi:glycerophosphoryl diester phosphodiesterase